MADKAKSKTRENNKSSKHMGGFKSININRDIRHLFESFCHGAAIDLFATALPFMPKVDVYEINEEILIIAELPGLEEKDIDVSLTNDVIILVGEKKDKEDERKICYKAERQFGCFTRAVPIPVEVNTEKVDAKFKNGVLKIILPKIPEAASKRKKIYIIAD